MSNDFAVFKTVLYYCASIIALPISTFFGAKILLFDRIYGPGETTGNVYSAIAAVIMLHVALGLFVYKAYSGGDEPPRKPEKLE